MEEYEKRKQKILEESQSWKEYETKIKKLCEEMGC